MTPLLPYDVRLLGALKRDGGFTTRDACLRAGLEVGRVETALARSALLHMKKVGLVGRLDDERPAAWVLTAEGAAELESRRAEAAGIPVVRVGEEG